MKATIPCVCSKARHETDTIIFRDRLDFRSGLAVRKTLALEKDDDPGMGAGEILAILTESYLVYGIESWTLKDADNKPMEPTRTNIRAFLESHPEEAEQAGNVADSIYQEQVLLPLLKRASTSQQPSPTPELTSPTPRSSGSRSSPEKSKPSKPSLTSITPTDDTETTTSAPAGDSRSSLKSA